MLKFIVRRILQTVPLLFLLSLLIFALFQMIPGDYLTEMELNPSISPQTVEQLRTAYGLDQPFYSQYFLWVGQILRGNLGHSFAQQRPAADLILDRLGNTLLLTLSAFALIMATSFPLAVFSALYPGRAFDKVTLLISLLGLSFPSLLVGVIFLLFAYWTSWFPIGGVGTVHHLALPSFTLALPVSAFFIRNLRLEMIEMLRQPFVIAAAARGIGQFRVVSHALRNALNPMISLAGITFGGLLSGAVLVEKIFDWPGLGALIVDSILSRDLFVALNCVLVSALLLVLCLCAAAAPFLAPYPPSQQFREFFYSSPTGIHFQDSRGWHLRPFVYGYKMADSSPRYEQTQRTRAIYFLVSGSPYRWLGMTWRTHLFGLSDGSTKIFLLGSDGLGRDLFSRILYGARFSLAVAIVATLLTVLLGAILGALAGYCGGWIDTLCMRLVDLFLSLPSLFLILAVRAVIPLELTTWELYWLMVFVFTAVGWASVSRVVRGQVMSLKTLEHVLAARVAGASHFRIVWRHIMPFTTNYLLLQSSILVPAFILGEITLSFLGVGVQEPDASWGSLLEAATSVSAVSRFPWLLAPVAFIFLTVLSFNLISDGLKGGDREARALW